MKEGTTIDVGRWHVTYCPDEIKYRYGSMYWGDEFTVEDPDLAGEVGAFSVCKDMEEVTDFIEWRDEIGRW